MRIPNLMLNLETSGWIGVDNATVGYGGTGPSNARRALVSVGIDDELADEIAFYNRVSHVLFNDHGNPDYIQRGSQWPRFGLSTPEAFGDDLDRFRIKLLIATDLGGCDGDDSVLADTNPDPTGFYPSPPDSLTIRERWLRYLDSPPAWLAPPEQPRNPLHIAGSGGRGRVLRRAASCTAPRSNPDRHRTLLSQFDLPTDHRTGTDPALAHGLYVARPLGVGASRIL